MYQIRQYQLEIAEKANVILRNNLLVCIFAMVRVGKTIMALQTCKLFNAKRVLFITKIKAFTSIKNDYKDFGFEFELKIINRESLHKLQDNDFDVVIVDEVHGYTSYPKPSKYYKMVKKRFGNLPMIMLSGTPTPESFSQYYHLFTLSNNSPLSHFKNFYNFFNNFGMVKTEFDLGYGGLIANYSNNLEVIEKYFNILKRKISKHNLEYFIKLEKLNLLILESFTNSANAITNLKEILNPFILTYTQAEAGFTSTINEHVLEVEMKPITYAICKRLVKDNVVTSSTTGKVILADTGVKLQQKLHQLFSGTVKYEDGSTQIIDNSKAIFIQEYFKGKKIAIFYNFIAELQMLKETFDLTTDLNEFNTTHKNIALQFVSGREGISLAKADVIVMFNIQFSAVTYWQARDRLTTMDRLSNDVYWIFSKGGIESKIYKSVQQKKNYTLSNFKNDFRK